MTETRLADPAGAAGSVEGSSDKDKGLKMKIKRSKAGRHNEGGKLEIVQGQAGAAASAAGGQVALESTAGPAINSILICLFFAKKNHIDLCGGQRYDPLIRMDIVLVCYFQQGQARRFMDISLKMSAT